MLLGEPRPPLAAYEAGVRSAAACLACAREDQALAARLLELPYPDRLEAASNDARFRRISLARLLAFQAESELFDVAGDARPLGELSVAVAGALAPGRSSRQIAALAHWLAGKSHLVVHDWRLAEESFKRGLRCLDSVPCQEHALLVAGRAQLDADVGDIDGAVERYLCGALLFAECGPACAVAACHAELGLLLLDAGEFINAGTALRAAVRLVDPPFAPTLASRVHLALAEIAALRGDLAGAADALDRARQLYALAPAAHLTAEDLERSWREARIAAAGGAVATAESRLDPVRRELLARGSAVEAGRATLEQALLRIASRRGHEVAPLAAAFAREFPGQGELWGVAIAALPQLAADGREILLGACRSLQSQLRLASPSEDRPAVLTPTRRLVDRLLRRRGEHEDPIGAAVA